MSEVRDFDKFYRDLFFREEFLGDKYFNYIRFGITFVVFFLALVKAGIFSTFSMTPSLKVTLGLIAFAGVYSVFIFFLYRKNIYHWFIKYISVTVDTTLIVGSVYVYKLDHYSIYANIFFLGRFSLIFIFIFLTLLRYNFVFSVYAGILAGIEYYLFIVLDNVMTGKVFRFTGPDGVEYTSSFLKSEAILKVVYLVITGFAVGLVAIKLRNLVKNSILREHEKNRLSMENSLIENVNRENRKYLENISQGLLLINSDLIVKGHYSLFLKSIFETDRIAGLRFSDLVYSEDEAFSDDREELDKFLNILFNNKTADLDMIMDINPIVDKKIIVNSGTGKQEKYISATFAKVFDSKQNEDEIIAVIEDRTEYFTAQFELEGERKRHENEMEYISAILHTSPESLNHFMEDSEAALEYCLQNLDKLSDADVLNKAFRGIHSLKGNAASLSFNMIADHTHLLEDELDELRLGKVELSDELRSDIRSKALLVMNEIDQIKHFQVQFRKVSEEAVDSSVFNCTEFFGTVERLTEEIAEKQDKIIDLSFKNELKEFPHFSMVKSSIIHLLKNCIDHGIEDKFERLSKYKSETGKIDLSFYGDGKNYCIKMSDDGRGIDFERVKKISIEKNLIPHDEEIDNKRLLNLLFSPGFSTAEEITDISGRGVGLDAVKDSVQDLNGTIAVQTKSGQGTTFLIRIPV